MSPAEILNTLVQKKDITAKDAESLLESIMSGSVSSTLTAGILTALRMKGESTEEIIGLVRAMRSHVLAVKAPDAIDVVGTGGDGSGTFNISTASALVVAGAGIKVAKHGNRAASSKCGSADVLEALGVNIQLKPEQAEEVLKRAGIVFLFAPAYHPAMKEVVAVRKELKIRTVFNVLGPFTNPASVTRALIGVPDAVTAKKMSQVARGLGYKHALIVTSGDKMDEVSIFAKSEAFEIRGTTVKKITIDPKKLGFKGGTKKDILGGSAAENAAIIQSVLAGARSPARDIVVLNSACALYAADAVKSIKDGILRAEHSLDSGSAQATLLRFIEESQKFS